MSWAIASDTRSGPSAATYGGIDAQLARPNRPTRKPSRSTEYRAGVRILVAAHEAKRLVDEWADRNGWVPINEPQPSLTFRREGLRRLAGPDQLDFEVVPDGSHLLVSIVASGPGGKTGVRSDLQQLANDFVQWLSLVLEGGAH